MLKQAFERTRQPKQGSISELEFYAEESYTSSLSRLIVSKGNILSTVQSIWQLQI